MQKLLREHGLTPLGTWKKSTHASVGHLRDQCPFGIAFDLPADWRTRSNVVYAFVMEDTVLYIGETTRGVGSRFEGYRYGNPAQKDTDNRIKLAITQALQLGKSVSIWVGQPIASLTLSSGELMQIPASKPLEVHLIQRLQPVLNVKNICQPTVVP